MMALDDLHLGLGSLSRLSHAVTRSISAENFTGEKGRGGMAIEGSNATAARELGRGWKVSPSITVPGNATVTLAQIQGPGAIQHIWLAVHPSAWRRIALRMYWDDEETPSVETPLGDFFCMGWCKQANLASLPVAINPSGGFNCYWQMAFRKTARITIENLGADDIPRLYYQIDYTLTDVPDDVGYLHAQWRRSNPLPYKAVHTIVDGLQGWGQYVGTYMAWGVNNDGWWGEGEVKFYIDGDGEFPTICGTGTEDYFGGAWCFGGDEGQYCAFSAPFSGLHQVIAPDELFRSQQRFGMYRWHVMDPIRFEQDLRMTIQALGWRSPIGGQRRYLARQDDIASVGFWYQAEPHAPFPELPDSDFLEVI